MQRTVVREKRLDVLFFFKDPEFSEWESEIAMSHLNLILATLQPSQNISLKSVIISDCKTPLS